MRRPKSTKLNARLSAIAARPAPSFTESPLKPSANPEPSRHPREKIFRPAALYYAQSEFVRCVLCDISIGGACAIMEGAIALPPIVLLKFANSGVVKKARVARTHANRVGLSFISPDASKDETAPGDAPQRPLT